MQKILLAAAFLVFAAPALANESAEQAASAYKIETTSSLKLKKGEKGDAHVTIVPRSDAHVSPDAPLSMSLSSGPAIKLAKTKLGRGDGTATPRQGVDFTIPVTAAASGKDEVKGQLSFFICTEKLCERQKRDVTVPVTVE
ncbi:MAG: hypothetical protein ACJ79Y_09075 [Myxococcales bacterium]